MTTGSVSRKEIAAVGAGATQEVALAIGAAVDRVHGAWGAPDTEQRAAVLAEVCDARFYYANPMTSCVGLQAFAGLITELTAAYPGHRPARTSGLDAHHDTARYRWGLLNKDGRVVFGGLELVSYTPDLRLSSITSFFGEPPAIRYAYQAA